MPRTYLCFVWHMHQPFYKDLASGEYQLPWTRMHALKDYYGMVKVLQDFPTVRQTFNLVPSLLVQIGEYARGEARDPFLRAAARPAESLTVDEQEFILRYFFLANVGRMINRYPRYAELYDAWISAGRNPARARRAFSPAAFRDLQVLSQLAWFDEEFIDNDAEVIALIRQGRDYTLAHQDLMARKQLEICAAALPVYEEFARRGQIEISTTPFYHPILPLLCDSNIARVSHPNVALPPRFQYPQDARHQIVAARDYVASRFGQAPAGLWPSEGSVSDETLTLAAEAGFRWAATDNGVLAATLLRTAGPADTYRPWLWKHGAREIHLLFRDHFLSDLIGFVYARMEPAAAAAHFLDRIRDNCAPLLAAGRDALVPVILDGENAWEHYDRGGRAFLRELYTRISADPTLAAVTVSEALALVPSAPLDRIFPGSWINANFDIWIGAEEDNNAWSLLLDARASFERVAATVPAAERQLAYEELLIAEGSDWCWWYGPEHHSDNRAEFDKLFRDHLAQVYRALSLAPPEELSRPILKVMPAVFHEPPHGPIRPVLDGEESSYFEWLGAGLYLAETQEGAMHGRKPVVQALRYGSDGQHLFLRLDFHAAAGDGLEVRLAVQKGSQEAHRASFRLSPHAAEVAETNLEPAGLGCAWRRILELSLSLRHIGLKPGQPARLQLSVWRDGLPVDALPPHGWLEISTADPLDWPL